MPLTVRGGTPGILCVLGTDARSDEHQVGQQRLAVAVGEAIKLALSNLNLQNKLREQAIRDPLTGLLNRRFLEETLARDVYRAQRRNSPLCVAMLDLDDFKQFNDTFGHDAGDSLLRELGRVIREKLRKSDILCRYGGDEFVILLPQTEKNSALVVAKRLQEMMRKTQFLTDEGLNLNVRCSMGLATYPEDAKSSHEIIRQADEMMYMVKNTTRDNIAVAQQGLIK